MIRVSVTIPRVLAGEISRKSLDYALLVHVSGFHCTPSKSHPEGTVFYCVHDLKSKSHHTPFKVSSQTHNLSLQTPFKVPSQTCSLSLHSLQIPTSNVQSFVRHTSKSHHKRTVKCFHTPPFKVPPQTYLVFPYTPFKFPQQTYNLSLDTLQSPIINVQLSFSLHTFKVPPQMSFLTHTLQSPITNVPSLSLHTTFKVPSQTYLVFPYTHTPFKVPSQTYSVSSDTPFKVPSQTYSVSLHTPFKVPPQTYSLSLEQRMTCNQSP